MKTYSGTLAADGNSTAVVVGPLRGSPRPIAIIGTGDFGGGTMSINVSADGSTYAPVKKSDGTSLSFTDDFADGLNLVPGMTLRMTLAGAGAPDLDWWILVDDGG